MFSRYGVNMHKPEETFSVALEGATARHSADASTNPISEYFRTADALVSRLIVPPFKDDPEVLGLLLVGVTSAVEFYFRSILAETRRICPRCRLHIQRMSIPFGAFSYYQNAKLSETMSAIEHESLAEGSRVRNEIKRFTGLDVKGGSSLDAALKQFDQLCTVRHAISHSRGLLGLNNAAELALPTVEARMLIISLPTALEFVKIAHNTVRAVNSFLFEELLFRWISSGSLTGRWRSDKKVFSPLVLAFVKDDENDFSSDPVAAYRRVAPKIRARMAAQAS